MITTLMREWVAWQGSMNGLPGYMLQAFILAGLIYFIYVRFIRKSHAEQLLKGLFIMLLICVGMWILAKIFYLQLLENVFAASILLLFIGLIVIFQPELRRMLLFLGQGELFGTTTIAQSAEDENYEYLIKELTETAHFLSKSKRGALIVLESLNSHGGDYLEMGTLLDAKLSTELMLTIFHHNTPLHDGAVVIGPDNRIIAAGVLLPLTEDPKLSWQYGTRHRAAIGLTEISNSRCIVISEETGSISLVEDGKLEKMASVEDLRKALIRRYEVHASREPSQRARLGERLSDLFGTEVLPNPIQKIFQPRTEVLKDRDDDKAPKPNSSK